MKQLKVAIIGQGRSGYSIHGSFLADNTDKFKVVAIVDLIEKRRLLAKERYGEHVIALENYKDLFGMDLDLVINSSYSHMHYCITKDLLKHGFNVLSEKPFCGSAKEAQDLIDTAKEEKRILAVFQNSRFAAYYMKIKEILDSKVLGDIIQVNINFSGFERRWDWQTLQSHNAGNLFNTGPHPLDQALQIFGEGMPEVKAFMRRVNTYGDAEDYAKVILYGQDKPLIDLEITSCQGYKPYLYNIQGSKGALTGTMTQIDWKYFKPEELPEQKLLISFDKEGTNIPAYCKEAITWYEEQWCGDNEVYGTFGGMTRRYYEMLYNHIVNGSELTVTLQQVKTQIAVIEEAHRQNPLTRKY
ncbi:MAG: Gfo/Idh/MocA family oxidoreductase [Clostridia bacterium]|jgi:predicted dehydrogenase